MATSPTLTATSLDKFPGATAALEVLCLAVVWSRSESQRVGEIAFFPERSDDQPYTVGRGIPHEYGNVELHRQRPGFLIATGPLSSPRISRVQLQVTVLGSRGLRVENVGKAPLLHRGVVKRSVEIGPGDVIEIRNEILLLCTLRRTDYDAISVSATFRPHAFGEPDALGMVGESPVVWDLRKQLTFAGERNAHVLLLGPSGTGKELAARALHAISSRSARPLVARNAATIPETLIDSELFGTAKNYPNAGMPERIGLIAEADASTLFLDEIGELPAGLQAHFLRVLDQGEYQRLGESRTRTSSMRLVAATNRPASQLKEDVLARLKIRIQIPDLNSHREDIPLLARHLVRRTAVHDPGIAARFLEGNPLEGEPLFSPALISALVQHTYSTNVRELEAFLWQSMAGSPSHYLEVCEGMVFRERGLERQVSGDSTTVERVSSERERDDKGPEERVLEEGATTEALRRLAPPEPPSVGLLPTPSQVQACLEKHGGVQEHVWPELGLANRFVLYRLIRKYRLKVPKAKGRSQEGLEEE